MHTERPGNVDEILQVKAKSGKKLMEKTRSEYFLQLSLKCFVNLFSIS